MNAIIENYETNTSDYDAAVSDAVKVNGADKVYLYGNIHTLNIISGSFSHMGKSFAYMTYMNIATGDVMQDSFAAIIDDSDDFEVFRRKIIESAAHIYAMAKVIHFRDLCQVIESLSENDIKKLVLKAYSQYKLGL